MLAQYFLGSEITFLHLSPDLFWLFLRNMGGTLPGVRATLSAYFTSNDIDVRKWRSFLGLEIAFFTLSRHISAKMAWNYLGPT